MSLFTIVPLSLVYQDPLLYLFRGEGSSTGTVHTKGSPGGSHNDTGYLETQFRLLRHLRCAGGMRLVGVDHSTGVVRYPDCQVARDPQNA
jgi:hypothetical protein